MSTVGTDISRADLIALQDLANAVLSPSTPYDLTGGNLATELQRIRTDLKAAIAADYLAAEFRVSTPQCVGVNPCPSPGENGRLYFGRASTAAPATNYLPFFKDVEFWYALGDGFTVDDSEISIDDDELSIDNAPPVIRHKTRHTHTDVIGVTGSYTIAFASVIVAPADCSGMFTITIPLHWAAGGSPVDPVKTDFSLVTDLTASTWDILPDGSGGWNAVITLTEAQAIPTGTTTLNHSFVSTGSWSFGNGSTVNVVTACVLEIAATTVAPAAVTAIHPRYSCRKVTIANVDNGNAYTVNTARGIDYLELSERLTIRGIWIARTLPTAATNPYIDQCIPPYVQRIVNGYFDFFLEITPSLISRKGVPTATALKNRLVPDDQSPPAEGFTSSSLQMLSPYNAPEDETVHSQSDNYPTFAAGATLALTIPFPYWLIAPWAQFPVDLSTVGNLLDILTNAGAPCLTIYFSANPGINPADSGTYQYTVNDTGGGGGTSASVAFSDIATALGPLTRTVYVLIQNTSGASVFLNVGQTLIPDEKTIREAIQTSVIAQWPVMRDTEDYPLFPNLDPFRAKWTYTTATALASNDVYSFNETIGNSASPARVHVDQRAWKITCTDAGASTTLQMFVSMTGIPDPFTPGTYDFAVLGELSKAQFESFYGAATEGTFFVTVLNNTSGDVSLAVTGRAEYNSGSEVAGLKFQSTPQFFPTNFNSEDPQNLRYGICESFSYNIQGGSGSTSNGKLIARRGYCIYYLRVQRLPVAHGGETDPAKMFGELPSTGLAAITVKIGQWRGLKHTDVDVVSKGDFIQLAEITIAAGDQDASADVFLPVIGGACLVYQSATPVRVEALANWQPMFHSQQYARAPIQCVPEITPELPADALWPDNGLRHPNAFAIGDEDDVQFPPSAAVCNDLIAALNLL